MNFKRILVIAVGIFAITAVILGSVHIYSTAVARKTIEQTLNNINLILMKPEKMLTEPTRFTYSFTLEIANPAHLTAEVELTSWQVQIDEETFTVSPINQWETIIHPKEFRDRCFSPKGEIAISEPSIMSLKEKEIVPLIITGEIKVTARQAWVTQSFTYDFLLDSSVIFS
ncbi:MAG: hypothetical protein PHW65_01465 [Dehalococcoidales bacterium]|jgi:hypothetical protein|nr:hypothetical protein [Dehalococcoidales bacterium]